MNGKFDAIYFKIKNQLNKIIKESTDKDAFDIEADVAAFLEYPYYEPLRTKFMNSLDEQLNKVKAADPRLKNVELQLGNGDFDFSEGIIYMEVDPNNINSIIVNPAPLFLSFSIDEVNDNEDIFNKSFAPYINIEKDDPKYPGMHTIQHECAHIIDLLENGSLQEDMHGDRFKSIELKLNEKTKLDFN